MNISFKPLNIDYKNKVMDIFNYYVENSFAAFPEEKLPLDFYGMFLKMCEGYPAVAVLDDKNSVIGFGLLRQFHPLPVFAKTAEITYFLKPEYTGMGLGKKLLDFLMQQAKEKGITSILASITSLNEGSINFHRKNGFVECGRFIGVGCKNKQVFDLVYMQRKISD